MFIIVVCACFLITQYKNGNKRNYISESFWRGRNFKRSLPISVLSFHFRACTSTFPINLYMCVYIDFMYSLYTSLYGTYSIEWGREWQIIFWTSYKYLCLRPYVHFLFKLNAAKKKNIGKLSAKTFCRTAFQRRYHFCVEHL